MKRYINTVKTLFQIANGKLFVVIEMFVSCMLYNLSNLLPPIATAGVIGVITEKNFDGIWYYAILYAVFYMIHYGTSYWNHYTYTTLAKYYHIEVQKKLFEHVANNDSIFTKISKGKITDTCSDDIRYLVDVMNAAAHVTTRLIQLFVIFIVFISSNIFVALIAIIIDLVYIVLMNNNTKKVAKHYEGTRKYEDKVIDTLNQMLTNIKQVKTLNLMPNLNNNLDKTRNKWIDEYNKKRKAITNRDCIMPYLIYMGKMFLYVIMAYLVINDKMTLDKLVLLIGYYELVISCTNEFLSNSLNLGNYGVRVNRIKTILDYKPDSIIDFGEINNDYINGTIVFDNVVYEKKKKKILNNVSFKIYPNEITTIVGHSGSGKTTIVNLLYRLDRIKSGSITIDNESIYNYTKKVYSSNVSGVFQKPFVFEMSIRDNLSLVDSNRKNQIEACKRVGIHDLIMSLPKGYNTIIGDINNHLSDGDKQILAIARALLSKAEILLLDEVTSNIDPSSTIKIGKILNDLKVDHTIVMITHKPEMMDIADRVIVLDNGKVIAKGTNNGVFNRCSLYRELKNRTFASVSVLEN